jgi:hypothetical protein
VAFISGMAMRRALFGIAVATAALLGLAASALAERPGTPELFPKDTAALVRIPNAPELYERFMNTSIGHLSRDEKIGPLFAELYGSATELFKQHVEEHAGVSLEELLSLPQGEVAFGVVTPEGVRPVFVWLVDTGEKAEAANKLLEKAKEALEKEGFAKTTEKIEELDLELTVYDIREDAIPQLVLFERDSTFVATTDVEMAKSLLARWTNPTGKPLPDSLAKNERYAAIMKRCRGEGGKQPHLTFFVDPMTILKSAAVGNIEMTLGLAILPQLGLDGFSGVGGSITFDADPYDYISHFHILIENPRAGVMKALALSSGDIAPPAWVPADITAFTCGHWDFQTTFDQVAKLVDSFQGEGRTAESVQNFMDEQWQGMNFQTDILDQLTGRVMHVAWMESPATLASQKWCLAAEIKDPESAQKWFTKIFEKHKTETDILTIGKVTYYQPRMARELAEREPRDLDEEDEGARRRRQRQRRITGPSFPVPCLAIVDNYVLFTSEPFLKKIVLAKDDPSAESLADSLEYKLVASRFERVAPGMKPGLITYTQPEQGMRWVYDFVTSEDTMGLLDDPDAPEPVVRLRDALEKHPLPPFEVIKKYLAPTGGVMINEPTGFHYTGFGLRRTLSE